MDTSPDSTRTAEFAAGELGPVRLGTALTAVGLVAAVAGLVLSPSADAGVWPVVSVVAAAPLVLVTVFQLWGWTRAQRDPAILAGGIARASFWLHVLSYLLVLLAMFAMLTVLVAANFADGRSVIMLFGVLALVLGQGLAAVRFLRTGGPAGTIPGHMQRLRELDRRRVSPPE